MSDQPEFAGFCACGGVFVKTDKPFHYVCNKNPNHTLIRIGLPLTPFPDIKTKRKQP